MGDNRADGEGREMGTEDPRSSIELRIQRYYEVDVPEIVAFLQEMRRMQQRARGLTQLVAEVQRRAVSEMAGDLSTEFQALLSRLGGLHLTEQEARQLQDNYDTKYEEIVNRIEITRHLFAQVAMSAAEEEERETGEEETEAEVPQPQVPQPQAQHPPPQPPTADTQTIYTPVNYDDVPACEDGKEEKEDCIMCAEAYVKDKVIVKCTGCNNLVHGACVLRWLQTKESCPFCRRTVSNFEETALNCLTPQPNPTPQAEAPQTAVLLSGAPQRESPPVATQTPSMFLSGRRNRGAGRFLPSAAECRRGQVEVAASAPQVQLVPTSAPQSEFPPVATQTPSLFLSGRRNRGAGRFLRSAAECRRGENP